MNAVGIDAAGLCLIRSGKTLLSVDRFACEPGETVVLIGPNGAGKSLLLESLCGLQRCGGNVRYFQQKNGSGRTFLPAHCVTIGAALQRLGLWGMARIEELLDLWAAVSGVPSLSHPFLERMRNREFRHLSQGERQFLFFALVMGSGADILMLDEPTMALDAALYDDVVACLHEEQRTQIVTTHSFELVLGCADRCYFVSRGLVAPLDIVRTEALGRTATVSAVSSPARPDEEIEEQNLHTQEIEIEDPESVNRIAKALIYLAGEVNPAHAWRLVLRVPAYL